MSAPVLNSSCVLAMPWSMVMLAVTLHGHIQYWDQAGCVPISPTCLSKQFVWRTFLSDDNIYRWAAVAEWRAGTRWRLPHHSSSYTVSGLSSEYLPGFMIFSYLISKETTAKNGKGVYNKSKIGEKWEKIRTRKWVTTGNDENSHNYDHIITALHCPIAQLLVLWSRCYRMWTWVDGR